MRMKIKTEKNQKNIRNHIILPRRTRVILFCIIVSVEWAINIGTGILSSASKNIKESLQMTDTDFGTFGAANGIGRFLGSAMYAPIFNTFPKKVSFIGCIVLKGLLNLGFKQFKNKWILVCSRGIIGFLHMPLDIYIILWIDQYGLQKYKTVFMTIHLVTMSIAKVTGYGVHYVVGEKNWQNGFVFEGSYLLLIGFLLFISPGNYFSPSLYPKKKKEDNETELTEINGENKQSEQIEEKITIFEEIASKDKSKKSDGSLIMKLYLLATNPLYVIIALIRSILMGVITSFHFWIGDYMRNILNVNDSALIFRVYVINSIVGPVIGIFISWLVKFIIPSYDHKYAAIALFALHLTASSFALSIPFMEGIYPFCVVVTFYLAFSSSATSFVQGGVAGSVPPELKGLAISSANVFHTAITSGPLPFIYGFLSDRFGSKCRKIGMISTVILYSAAMPFTLIYIFLKRRQIQKEEKEVPFVDKEKKKEEL